VSFTVAYRQINFVEGKMSNGSEKTDVDPKTLQPPADKALVYVVRPSRMAFGVKMKFFCDEQLIGKTRAKQFLYMLLDPGEHHFLSKSENKSKLDLTLEAGKTYYLQQKVRFGILFARTKLALIDEAHGRVALYKCKLPKK
jgi:hypothetical protein